MARKNIKKSVVVTTLKVAEVLVSNGEIKTLPLGDLNVRTKLTDEKAMKYANAFYKGKQVIVLEKQEIEKIYTMSVEEFISLAKEEVQDITKTNTEKDSVNAE